MVKPVEIVIPADDILKDYKFYTRPMRLAIELRKSENSKLSELQSLLFAKMGRLKQ
jgi:hypothetical protein